MQGQGQGQGPSLQGQGQGLEGLHLLLLFSASVARVWRYINLIITITYSYLLQIAAKPTIAIKQQQ